MTLRALWQNWCTFFFAPQSPLPVCVCRILVGAIVFYNSVGLWPDFLSYYGKNVPIPIDAVIVHSWHDYPTFDLLLLLGDDRGKYIILALLIVASVTMTIGLFSRFSCLTACLILLSMHRHCPQNINSGDVMVRLVCLWLACSACGACLSVDSLIKNFRRDWRLSTLPQPVCPWGQRMLQLQLSIAYWDAFFCKLDGEHWIDGSAVYMTMREREFFTGLPMPSFLESALVCRCLTWYTLMVEGSLAFLVWFKEIRYFVLLNGMILHCGISYTMNLGMFEQMFMVLFVPFIDPTDLQKIFDKVQSFIAAKLPPPEKALRFDQHCPACLGWAGTFHRLDYFRRLQWQDDGEPGSHLVVSTKAGQLQGVRALRAICMAVPQLWLALPLLFVPAVGRLWNGWHAGSD